MQRMVLAWVVLNPLSAFAALSVGTQSDGTAWPARAFGRSAMVVFDNVALNGGLNVLGASPASQHDGAFAFEAGAADDFVLPSGEECLWAITRVQWSGRYWGDGAAAPINGFRIMLWPDVNGTPDGGGQLTPDVSHALRVYEITGSANEAPNGAGSPGSFDYWTNLPEAFEAIPGVRYWIQIQAVAPAPPQWGLQVTQARQGAAPVAYFDLLGIPAWSVIRDPGDLAFQLLGEPRVVVCDDGNACTADGCEAGACVFSPLSCNDGDACTADHCNPGQGCVFTAVFCDDGNACTSDTCDPQSGCTYDAVVCDDQSACTVDSCDPAQGCLYASVTCNDGNGCTEDSCDPATGCTIRAINCDDGDPCSVDACAGELCTHTARTDSDGNGQVDGNDLSRFIACMTGTGGDSCVCADLDGDGAVNLCDYAEFQASFTGSP